MRFEINTACSSRKGAVGLLITLVTEMYDSNFTGTRREQSTVNRNHLMCGNCLMCE